MPFDRLQASYGLGPYSDLLAGALQPSVLMLDPAKARAQFLADLGRMHGTHAALRDRDAQQQAHEDEQRRYALRSGRHGFGFLAPGAEHDQQWNPRPRIAPASGYMVDAILRDAALAQYDRSAPQLRDPTLLTKGTPHHD